jgi:hypothetical protein
MISFLELAFPAAAAVHLFGWHTNEAHLTADPPEDHTPFSATGWPLPTPLGVVTATDVMDRPDLGVVCAELVPYWLDQCRSGAMRWVKYINWQGKRYDVRNGWAPVPTAGHYDHAHISARSDNLDTTLAGWSVTPGGDIMPALTADEQRELLTATREVRLLLTEGKRLGPAQTADGGVPIPWIVRRLWELGNEIDADAKLIDVDALAVSIVEKLGPETGAALAASLAARLAA